MVGLDATYSLKIDQTAQYGVPICVLLRLLQLPLDITVRTLLSGYKLLEIIPTSCLQHLSYLCSMSVQWRKLRRIESCCFLSAPSSKALLFVCIAWLTSERFLMAHMLIRKVQTIAGCSMMEEFLIPDLALYVFTLIMKSLS